MDVGRWMLDAVYGWKMGFRIKYSRHDRFDSASLHFGSVRWLLIPLKNLNGHGLDGPFRWLFSLLGGDLLILLSVLYTEFYEPVELRRGDSAYYDATMGHNVLSISQEDANVLWVTSLV